MQLHPIGTTGVHLTTIGLGGYELGPEPDEAPNVERAVAVIETSIAAGVNWLDTSENYLDTRNESLIGPALKQVPDAFVVASKVAPSAGVTGGGTGFRRDQIHAASRASLRRLERDVIDVYFLHWPDSTGIPLTETWGAMAELVDEGLVRTIGLSNYEIADVEACNMQRRVDVVQTGLSMIDYLDDREMIARCGELGIDVVIYEPLASGILTGKTLEEVRATWTGPWVHSSFYQRLLAPGRVERSFAVADGVRAIAQRLGSTVAQVAIAWVLRQPGVTAAIAGSKDGRHMRENAEAADMDLGDALDELDGLISFGPAFG